MDPALDRSKRLLQHLGDLVILEAIEVEQEGVTEDLRQLVYGSLDIFYPQIALHRTCDGSLIGIEQEFVGTAIKNGILLGFTAVIIDEDIPHDGVKPCFDISAHVIFILI